MYKYGQYCPVARALEILGDRWTLLIVRDLLTGTSHFNDLVRGLPGISRGLLTRRLERLERTGVIEKHEVNQGRRSTEYVLTPAGEELTGVIEALLNWGAHWAFAEPSEQELDPILLLRWMRGRVCHEQLPQERVMVQFDFYGPEKGSYWLLLSREDVSVCLNYPGFDIDILVTSDLSLFYQVWLGRISYHKALSAYDLEVEAIPALRRAFPNWFAWSHSAEAVRLATSSQIS